MKSLIFFTACMLCIAASCSEDIDDDKSYGLAWYVNGTGETLTLKIHRPEPFKEGYYVWFEEIIAVSDSIEIGLTHEAGLVIFSGKGDSLTLETPSFGCKAYSRSYTRAPSVPCCGEGPFRWDDYTRVSERETASGTSVVMRLVINARTFSQGGPCP